MSATMRWILAMFVFLLGLAAAAFTVFGGAFSTVACVEVPPDWVYYLLLVVGVLVLASALVISVLIIRRAPPIRLALPAVLGVVFLCGGLVAYFVLLGQYC